MAVTEGIQKAFLAAIIPQDFKATGFGPFICLFAFQTEKTVILMYVVKELFRIPDYIRMDKEEK